MLAGGDHTTLRLPAHIDDKSFKGRGGEEKPALELYRLPENQVQWTGIRDEGNHKRERDERGKKLRRELGRKRRRGGGGRDLKRSRMAVGSQGKGGGESFRYKERGKGGAAWTSEDWEKSRAQGFKLQKEIEEKEDLTPGSTEVPPLRFV